ncbi:hypothetical protein AAFC00_000215 [Neodothiora populina]|uniref:Choline kinase N-terminal domain-containing protein n=1 Tax=Neodothiora populina TaxID=2781224 RepID=A0ABR3P2B0_9PEZI
MAQRRSPKVQGILKNDEPISPSNLLGVNHAISPRATPKSVSIAPHAETISPLILGAGKDVDELQLDRVPSGPRPHIAKGPGSKRLSGRRSHNASVTSLASFGDSGDGQVDEDSRPSTSEHYHMFSGGLVGQVTDWIREERTRRAARKAKRKAKWAARQVKADAAAAVGDDNELARTSSSSSSDSTDLARLEQILKESFSFDRSSHRRRPSQVHHRKRPSVKSLHRSSNNTGASSDTEYYDGDILVPSAEAWLDNSKTLAYSGGGVSTDDLSNIESSKSSSQAWATFRYEIVRLTHTLRLKGWRRVPMDMSNEIEVDRLSGALTNAVYVVSPPQNIPSQNRSSNVDGDGKPKSARPPPPKLLLRIYGPQVEHLIDREAELQILRRLARKRIGPRMLGTFSNGRFEEFFHARTLTPSDLRNPDTSKHIAKRMRELHEGVDLLERERDDGPFVWRNWDKWVQRVGDVASWLDKEVSSGVAEESHDGADAWKTRGFVCGTEWGFFKSTLEKYRRWLEDQYAKPDQLRQRLVFAHNDTQYGNILRLLPAGTSPLLLPANTHKQLIVIDFEYASANTPGLEFANHFTEWCYNYHDPQFAWKCNTKVYPTPDEQDRFVRAYVRHRPQFNVSTPKLGPTQHVDTSSDAPKRPQGPNSSISNFMLDARNPAGSSDSLHKAEEETSAVEDAEVKSLLQETRLWRLANTAQWVAWGIVQAKVPGLPLFSPSASAAQTPNTLAGLSASPDEISAEESMKKLQLTENGNTEVASDSDKTEIEEMRQDIEAKRPDAVEENDEEAEEEFDYLRYARDRAMFFWGDAIKLGFVKEEELPESIRKEIKTVDY